jgi:predicted O-methyltransferase YrrM
MNLLQILTPIISKIENIRGEVTKLTLDEEKIKVFYQSGIMLCPLEIKLLSFLSQKVDGDYIELGVNFGSTALNICKNNPDKKVYGVDYIETEDIKLSPNVGRPNKQQVAINCIQEPNFKLFLEDSQVMKLPENLGLVFIDADHSYEGVKRDTENILSQVEPGTILVWHDYHAGARNGGEDYNKIDGFTRILDYVNGEVTKLMKVYYIVGTWFAVGMKE